MTTTTVRNGIDVNQLLETIETTKTDGTVGTFTFRATSTWKAGTHNVGSIDGFTHAAQGIDITRMDYEVEGDLDVRSFLGPEGPRPGFTAIRVTGRGSSPNAPREQLAELCEHVQATSPVRDIIAGEVPVATSLEEADPHPPGPGPATSRPRAGCPDRTGGGVARIEGRSAPVPADVDLDEARRALAGAGRDVAALLRTLEPADHHRPVPGVGGTVGDIVLEVAALLAREPRRVGPGRRRRPRRRRAARASRSRRGAPAAPRRRAGRRAGCPHTTARARPSGRSRPAAPGTARRASRRRVLPRIRPRGRRRRHRASLRPDVDGPRPTGRDLVLHPARPGLTVRVGGGGYAVQRRAPGSGTAPVDPVEALLAVAGRLRPGDPRLARLPGWFSGL
jgi:hypothetical protein